MRYSSSVQNVPPYPLQSVDNALRLAQLLQTEGSLRLTDAAAAPERRAVDCPPAAGDAGVSRLRAPTKRPHLRTRPGVATACTRRCPCAAATRGLRRAHASAGRPSAGIRPPHGPGRRRGAVHRHRRVPTACSASVTAPGAHCRPTSPPAERRCWPRYRVRNSMRATRRCRPPSRRDCVVSSPSSAAVATRSTTNRPRPGSRPSVPPSTTGRVCPSRRLHRHADGALPPRPPHRTRRCAPRHDPRHRGAPGGHRPERSILTAVRAAAAPVPEATRRRDASRLVRTPRACP